LIFTLLENEKFKKFFAIVGISNWTIWVLLVLAEEYALSTGHWITIPIWSKALFFNIYVLAIYFYYSKQIDLEENGGNFYNLIWQSFVTGVTTTFASIVFIPLIRYLQTKFDVIEANISLILGLLYHLELGLMMFFLISLYAKWKKLILYSNADWVSRFWRYFEIGLLATLFLHFFDVATFQTVKLPLTIFLGLLGATLSVNLSWVAYLNLRQKGMLMLFVVVIIFCILYFFSILLQYSEVNPIDIRLSESPFMYVVFAFLLTYSVFIELVLFFNLPTSSVFERKFNEIANFQKLSESILEGRTEKQVYEVLLDSALNVSKAQAGYVEISKSGEVLLSNVLVEDVKHIKRILQHLNYDYNNYRKVTPRQYPELYAETGHSTLLVVPLVSHQHHLGTLVLLKESKSAFDNVMLNLINTYVTQASIALENFTLISQTVENERYKSELQTAKLVKEKLLPKNTYLKDRFEFYAFSASPDAVGGDYYNYFEINETKTALIIADVSGKGTSAAFNMAQVKGIFQTLLQFDLSPDLFMKYANTALNYCLEKQQFVTASYFLIDTQHKKVYYARAGHCPSLHFSVTTQTVQYYEGRGLGLGLIRNEKKYETTIELQQFDYQSGDMLLLFTDGVVECTAPNKEEYGYERLKNFFGKYAPLELPIISQLLLDELQAFSGSSQYQDDYTIMLVRFH